MLRILKSNHPAVILPLILTAFLLRVVIFLFPAIPSSEFNNPLGKLFIESIHRIPFHQNLAHTLVAAIVILIEAFYFNRILIRHKIAEQRNFLGAYCFLLLSSLFTDFLYLSPSLIVNLFLLIILDKLFAIYRNEKMSSQIFDLGFIISLASLFYFPTISFLAFIIIGMATLRPVRINEYLILLAGAVIPYFLTGVYYFWNDALPLLWRDIAFYWIQENEFHFTMNYSVLIIGIFTLLIIGWAVFITQLNYFKTVVQIRNYFAVLFWLAAMGFLSLFFHHSVRTEYFLWLIIPGATAISYAIPKIKRAWIGEIVHLTLLLLVIYFQFSDKF